MATMRIPAEVSRDQLGHARKTIVVDGVLRDVAVQWRGTVTLNVDLAEQLWAMRGGNKRPFIKSLAFRYADEMRSGGWGLVHASQIAVTRDGILGNGQHRVAAVLASGVSINVDLALGVHPDAMAFEDCGRNRSMSVRHAMIDGNTTANHYAAALAATLIRLASGQAAYSVRDVEAIETEYGDSIRAVATRLGSIGKRKGIARAGANASIVQYHHHSRDAAVEFMDSFYVPDGDVQPARMLRDYFLTNTRTVGSAVASREDYERTNTAIAATIRGDSIKQLKRTVNHPCGPIRFARPKGEKMDWSFV